jgi:hypothetical protein
LAVPHRLVRECLNAAIATAHADEEEAELDCVFEDMREREEGEERVFQLEAMANKGDNRANGRDEVRMLQDDTLGRACGTRRVHDASHVIAGGGATFRQFGWLLTAEFA